MSPDEFWKELLRFYSHCLEHEGAFAKLLQRSASRGRYLFPAVGTETLVCGISDEISLDEGSADLAKVARDKGDALFYGWPTVLLTEPVEHSTGEIHQRRKLAPLLVLELTLPPMGQPIPAGLVPSSDVPTLHPTILSRLGYKEENVAQLLSSFPIEPHLGSAEAMADYVVELGEQIGLEINGTVDPTRLDAVAESEIDGVGIHNVATLFRGPSAGYHQHLLRELRELEELDPADTAAAPLLVSEWQEDASASSSPLITSAVRLNESQEQAIRRAMSSRLTVVTGPPGTGKSQLVLGLLSTCCASGQSVLVASTNNQAVDVVAERGQQVSEGLVIRTGNRENRDQAKSILEDLVKDRESAPKVRPLRTLVKRSRERIDSLREAFQKRTELETHLTELAVTRERLADEFDSTTDRWDDLGSDLAVRWGHWWARRLRAAIWFRSWRYRRLARRYGFPDDVSFLPLVDEVFDVEHRWRRQRSRLSETVSPGEVERKLVEAEERHTEVAEDLVTALVRRSVQEGESEVRKFTRTDYNWKTKTGLDGALPDVLPFLKNWACTALSIAPNAPLEAGLFDLVVIDEASQCSIASALPLLFRGKRAVIIGDPNQLTHIAGIKDADEEVCARKAGLDRKDLVNRRLSHAHHSIYSAFDHRASSIIFLDEHYRSDPEIIRLSNELFYGEGLTILTSPSKLMDFGEHAVAWKDVRGKAIRPKGGSAMNRKEASAVAEMLGRIAGSRPDGCSVGVVTPFSAQARLINSKAEQQLAEKDRVAMDLEIGTVHRFQGDERDIMVFSPVAAEGMARSSLSWLIGTPNLFNVAVSRARSYLLVVGDFGFCAETEGLLGELADYVKNLEVDRRTSAAGLRGDLDSLAEERLYRELVKLDIEATPKRDVFHYECDFVVESESVAVNVECDGRHHFTECGRKRRQDIARDRLIESKGYDVVRVPAWRCLEEPRAVAQEIRELMKT